MGRDSTRATREATGCFLILVLGAIVCVGFMRIAMLAVSDRAHTGEFQWWHTIVLWLIAPVAAIAVVAWFTYGFTSARSRKRPGESRGGR